MEFSKKMLVLHIFISVVLCGITVAGTLRGWDVTAIAVLAGTSLVTDGTWGRLLPVEVQERKPGQIRPALSQPLCGQVWGGHRPPCG